MSFDNKQFIPKSPDQYKKEYLETPFWLARFQPGSQFTIVEDLPRNKPMRYIMKPSTRGGPAFATNLIKVSDGFVEKDLELSPTNAQLLFITLPGPEVVKNLKGCSFANNNGRWEFISQDTSGMNGNFPKSQQIANSIADAPTEIGNQIKSLHAAMQTNQATKITNTVKVVMDIAEKIRPGDALNLISEAKKQGYISERTEAGVTVYRAE